MYQSPYTMAAIVAILNYVMPVEEKNEAKQSNKRNLGAVCEFNDDTSVENHSTWDGIVCCFRVPQILSAHILEHSDEIGRWFCWNSNAHNSHMENNEFSCLQNVHDTRRKPFMVLPKKNVFAWNEAQ